MDGREQRVLLRHYLEQGLSRTEISRQLGVSLRILYYWIPSRTRLMAFAALFNMDESGYFRHRTR